MIKSQIYNYLDSKRREQVNPLYDKLKQLKNNERIKLIEEQYPDFIPAVEAYIDSKNAVCDILVKMDKDDFPLDFNDMIYRENDPAREFVIRHSWMRDGCDYSVDVEALEEKIVAIGSEYRTLEGNIKGMTDKKAIDYLQSLGFDIQPEAPSYLQIAPVDTQLLMEG